MTQEERNQFADQLFEIANKLAGDETGHLAAILHSVSSELRHGVNAFEMINKVQVQEMMIQRLKGGIL